MSSYCAPCLADLALVRDAVTSVNGTAACVAHAVLLTHPGDSAQRRLQRLSDLRSMAEGKLATASADDVPSIELLIQEYALAGAMDMTVPLKDLAGERAPRPPKKRRGGRDRDRERGPREFPVETRPVSDGSPEAGEATTPPPDAPEGEGAPASDSSADSLVAPEGVNSSSTGGQEGPDAAAPVPSGAPDPAPSEAPVGE